MATNLFSGIIFFTIIICLPGCSIYNQTGKSKSNSDREKQENIWDSDANAQKKTESKSEKPKSSPEPKSSIVNYDDFIVTEHLPNIRNNDDSNCKYEAKYSLFLSEKRLKYEFCDQSKEKPEIVSSEKTLSQGEKKEFTDLLATFTPIRPESCTRTNDMKYTSYLVIKDNKEEVIYSSNSCPEGNTYGTRKNFLKFHQLLEKKK